MPRAEPSPRRDADCIRDTCAPAASVALRVSPKLSDVPEPEGNLWNSRVACHMVTVTAPARNGKSRAAGGAPSPIGGPNDCRHGQPERVRGRLPDHQV